MNIHDSLQAAEVAIACSKKMRAALTHVYSQAESMTPVDRLRFFRDLKSYIGLELQDLFNSREGCGWYNAPEASAETPQTDAATTTRERILEILKATALPIHINAIASEIPETSLRRVQDLVYELTSRGVLTRTGKGLYQYVASEKFESLDDAHIAEAILATLLSSHPDGITERVLYNSMGPVPRDRVLSALGRLVSAGTLTFEFETKTYRAANQRKSLPSTVLSGTKAASTTSDRVSTTGN